MCTVIVRIEEGANILLEKAEEFHIKCQGSFKSSALLNIGVLMWCTEINVGIPNCSNS